MAKYIEKVVFDLYRSYLAKIRNSVGSKLFRNNYGTSNGQVIDLTEDGEHSCGAHVSGILVMCGLVKEMHTTVTGTIKDLADSGWFEINQHVPGAVLLWEKQKKRNGPSEHIGFCVGIDRAVSNLDQDYDTPYPGCPNEHSIDFDGTRKISKIFWHTRLGDPQKHQPIIKALPTVVL